MTSSGAMKTALLFDISGDVPRRLNSATQTAAGIMTIRRRLAEYGAVHVGQRYAANTTKGYDCAERRWFEFCADAGYSWRNWSEETTFGFVCWRRTIGVNKRTGEPVRASTLRTQLSAVKGALVTRGISDLTPYSKHTMPRTSALLRALARKEIVGYKKALTGQQLRRIFALLPPTYDAMVWAWAVSLIHNTMRRVSEVMPSLTPAMVAGDITWSSGSWRPRQSPPYDTSASYAFRQSKTNRYGQLQTAFMWCRCATSVCALCRLRKLYRRCPWSICPRTPLLLLESGKVLDYRAAMNVLKALCIRCGYNPNDYGMHSLRRGGLHDAQDEGLGDSFINGQAYWLNNRSRRPYERSREAIDAQKRRQLLADLGTVPRPRGNAIDVKVSSNSVPKVQLGPSTGDKRKSRRAVLRARRRKKKALAKALRDRERAPKGRRY